MPLIFLWDEVERLMEIRGIPHRDALAEKAGIHRTNLHKISKGTVKPSFAALGKICAALQCQPGALLKFEPDEDGQ